MNKIIKIVIILFLIVTLLVILFKILNVERKILEYLYPQKFEEYVYKYSEEAEIDPMLTFAIIKTESNFNKEITSKSGAVGLMQIMNNTAKEQAENLNIEYKEDLLYNPEVNIRLGVNYFKKLLDSYNQNYILAFASYNAGLGNVQKWIKDEIIKSDGSDIENIPFKETNMYVRKIIKNYEMYNKLYLEK